MPLIITSNNFESSVMQSPDPVILYVYATWCGPCQQMAPLFEELEKELGSEYRFAKLNVDEARDISIQLNVTFIPTFVFIKDGQIKGKETGVLSKDALKAKLTTYFG